MSSRPWLLALVLAAGCSSYDPALVLGHGDLERLPRVAGHRVAVLLPELPPGPEAFTDDDGETPRGALPFDARRLQEEIVAALERVLPERAVVAVSDPEALGEAWEAGYDVVLRTRAVRWEAVFLGTNGWWYPNAFFLSWYFFPIGPQWLVADERYGVACELEVTAESAASERPLPTLTARVLAFASPPEPQEPDEDFLCGEASPTYERCPPPTFDLDDTQRGIDLFGTYDPGDLDAGQWEQVGALLAPFAYRYAGLRTAAALAEALPAFDALSPEARREAAATTHALVIGLTDDGTSTPCPGAADDARRLAQTLTSPGWAPAKNVLELTNANATRERVLAALARLAARTGPDDTLVVSFAGRGRRAQDEAGRPESHALVLADGALTLRELLDAVHAAPAARRLLVLDADFEAGARGATLEGLPQAARPLHEALAAALAPEDVVVLASSGGREAVQTWEHEQGALGGLLSTFVARALAGDADLGQDGLTLGDLAAYLDARVPHVALTLARPQRPRLVVVGDAGARMGEPLRP